MSNMSKEKVAELEKCRERLRAIGVSEADISELIVIPVEDALQHNLSIVSKNLELSQKKVQELQRELDIKNIEVEHLNNVKNTKLSGGAIQRRYNVIAVLNALINNQGVFGESKDYSEIIAQAESIVDEVYERNK